MFDRRKTALLGFVLAAGTLANADVLHLKTGGRVEGIVLKESAASVTMDIGLGQISVPRSNVARIDRNTGALSEYRARLSRISPGDVVAYVDLARFATDSGLRSEARSLWARVASLDPMNVEAHLALGHVLVDGRYVDEAQFNREQGLIYFEGRWMTPAEQGSLLHEREQRRAEDRLIDRERRMAREEEDRARRAEAEAARARAEAAAAPQPLWGYGGPVLVGSPFWGGYTAGCSGSACNTVPPIWTAATPPPPTPIQPPPQVRPIRPSSIR